MAEEKIRIVITGDAKSVTNALGQVNTGIQTMQQKLQSAAQTMTSIGTKMSLAVTAPLVLIGKKSLSMAMDVVESENLFSVSLGKMEDAARKWSETFSESVGLNEYEVRRQIGTFDVMLKSMGLTEQAALEMSEGFTELAYDMASFYNLRPEEAFDKLKSGIVGMPRPLQDLGIVVNESTVQMYAYKNGIAEVGEQLTESQKVMARYGAILERTSAAQGDMARTLESPANQMRIFKEQVNLAMIELGRGLIPVMQKVLNIVKPYIEKFTDLNDIQKEWIVKIAIAAAAAGPLALMTGQVLGMAAGFTKLAGAIGLTNKALLGAGGALALFAGLYYGTGKAAEAVEDLDFKGNELIATLIRMVSPLNAVIKGFKENIEIAKALADGTLSLKDAGDLNIFTIGEHIEKVKQLREAQEGLAESNTYLGSHLQLLKNGNEELAGAIDATNEALAGQDENAGGAAEEVDNLKTNVDLLSVSEVIAEDKTDRLKEAIANLDKITLGAVGQALKLKSAIDALESKTIYITTFYEEVSKGVPGRVAAMKSQKQSGGIQRETGFIPDLGIVGVKGEGIIPAYLMKAIKENRGSYAGIPTGGGGSVSNYFNISELVVREEADINNIAEKLYSMQLQSLRGAGIR